ncbi:putative discs large protein, partial [Operophtera brumata]
TEHRTTANLPSIPIPIQYDVLASSFEAPSYSVKPHAHVMSAPYDSLQYDFNKQSNEGLKQQCEKALHDLNQLRRQHTETSRRAEHVMKELEYFRGQHRAAMNQLEVSAQEARIGVLQRPTQSSDEPTRSFSPGGHLEREVQHLQQSSNPEGGYEDLIENHNTTLEKMRIVQDENSRLKTQCHELTQERNGLDNSAYHHLGLASGVGNDGFLNGQHSNDPLLDKLQGGGSGGEGGEGRVDNLEQANQELQRLRTHAGSLQGELLDAQREAEERDQMVGELADARRQSKKSTDNKDMKSIRASMASDDDCRHSADSCRHSADSCRHSADSCRHSVDSAIVEHDGCQDFEYDIIEIELSGLCPDGTLGFSLAGGRDEPYFPHDTSIYVTAVTPGSQADGKI